jgi:hypothetical protein
MEAAVLNLLLKGTDNPYVIAEYDYKYSKHWKDESYCCYGWDNCKKAACLECKTITNAYVAGRIMSEAHKKSFDSHGEYGVCGDRMRCNICCIKLNIHNNSMVMHSEGCLQCCDIGQCGNDEEDWCVYCNEFEKYKCRMNWFDLITIGR